MDCNSEMQRTRLQNIELDMLKIVDSICQSLNIQYFLIGGTLLGAVRHKGFIPWDDDIDIGMLRPDYDRFIKEGPQILPDHLFLQCRETERFYPHIFTKIRNCETTFIEKTVKNIKMNHGVFIDVFPFDYYPDKKIKKCFLSLKLFVLSDAISRIFFVNRKKQSFFRKIIRFFSTLIFPDYTKAVSKRNKLISSQKKSSLIRNYGGAWGKKEIFPASYFKEFCKMPYENYDFWVPKMYHEILTQMYDDYMTPPPVEKRVAHHYTDIIDLDKPYAAYIKNKEE